jgi:DNA-directed RNA polymerase subunit RPC12/RpoP
MQGFNMDDRELAREILSGQITVDQAAKMRSTTAPAQTNGRTAPATAAPPIQPGAVPTRKDPTVTSAPASGRKFPCAQCGARLDFDPSERALKCPYCGHEEQIAPENTRVVERDYAGALAKSGGEDGQAPIEGRSQEIRCPGCGANVLLEDNVETDRCPFCATALTNLPRQQSVAQIQPEYTLPFKISSKQSVEAFNAWIASRWFAPGNLRQLANLGQLSGVYLPFWTYDSMTYTHYTGQRGDDYWETESYTETDAQGRCVTRTRQVRRTRWHYVSGEVDHFFDDVLVCASRSLPDPLITHLEPWDLGHLEGFQPQFLAGFRTERYTIGLADGFAIARQIMDGEIRTLCCQDIGGDHQSLEGVQTQHVGMTYKHILLPVWLAVYRYQNQTYRIAVNARTGEVAGDRPYSWIKIALLVLVCAIVLALVIGLVMAGNHR